MNLELLFLSTKNSYFLIFKSVKSPLSSLWNLNCQFDVPIRKLSPAYQFFSIRRFSIAFVAGISIPNIFFAVSDCSIAPEIKITHPKGNRANKMQYAEIANIIDFPANSLVLTLATPVCF